MREKTCSEEGERCIGQSGIEGKEKLGGKARDVKEEAPFHNSLTPDGPPLSTILENTRNVTNKIKQT